MTSVVGAPRALERDLGRVTVMHVMPDLQIGGGQTIVLQGLQHLDADRYRAIVVTLGRDRHEMAPAFRAAGAHVVELGTGASWRSAVALRRLITEHRVDLLQTHNDLDRKIAQPVAALTGTPVVGHLHAEWNHFGSKASPQDAALRRARSRMLSAVRDTAERRSVKHYIAESDRVGQLFAPIVRAPITVLQQAVPVDRYAAASASGARAHLRQALSLSPATTVLLDVSRLVPGKGQADLLPLVAQLRRAGRDVALLLVGDGELRPDLEEAATAQGVRESVRFLGSRTDVPELMSAADLFVFPSYTEGFGMVALEAMAAGLPVVAYDLPPFHEFMQVGHTADLVPVGDVEALTAAVERLLADPLRASRMGAAAAAHVRGNYPPDSVAKAFSHVYDLVLRDAGPRRLRPRRTGGAS